MRQLFPIKCLHALLHSYAYLWMYTYYTCPCGANDIFFGYGQIFQNTLRLREQLHTNSNDI